MIKFCIAFLIINIIILVYLYYCCRKAPLDPNVSHFPEDSEDYNQ